MATKGYGAYRGRSRFRTFLGILIAVLLLLLILLIAAFFLLEPYILYSADGIRIDLSFLPGRDDPPVVETSPLALATPDPALTPEPTPTPSPTPTPVPVFHGVELAPEALYDGTARSQVEAAGGNAAVFNMKTDEGTLEYVSQLAAAVQAKVSAPDPAINAAIRLLNSEEELYTVARVSCFRDNTVPRSNMGITLKSSAGNWRDGGNYRWLTPASPEARAYVVGVCVELAELGFDELLLDNCGFPTQGRTGSIVIGERYDPDNLSQPLELFLTELEAALANYPDVKISIRTSEAVLTGAGDSSGQTRELLAEHGWRLWVTDAEGTDFTAALAELELTPERLVKAAGEVRPLGESWVVVNW